MQAVITSYNFLGQLRDNSKDLTFRVVIMDEALNLHASATRA